MKTRRKNGGWLAEHTQLTPLGLAKEMANDARIKDLVVEKGSPPDGGHTMGTLANRLRELSRGENATWWMSIGAQYREALKDQLGMDLDQLDEVIRSFDLEVGDDLFSFDWFPALRPLRVSVEDPFPGIPMDLLRSRPNDGVRRWWFAPPGAGKSLIGRWLRVRGWDVFNARTPEDFAGRKPLRGRVYVEWKGGVPPFTSLAEAMKDVPKETTLYLAAEFPLKMWRDIGHSDGEQKPERPRVKVPGERSEAERRAAEELGFLQVDPLPVRNWFAELIAWAVERVTEADGLNARTGAAVANLLRDHDELRRLFVTPGDLLGFLGLVHHTGLERLVDRESNTAFAADTVLEQWTIRGLGRTRHGLSDTKRRNLASKWVEQLIGIEIARLRRFWPEELDVEQWREIFPEDESAAILAHDLLDRSLADAEALKKFDALRKRNGDIEVLRELFWVSSEGSRQIGVQPRWIRPWLREAAFRELWREGAESRALLLLNRETSAAGIREMANDLCTGRARQWRIDLDAFDSGSAEYVALVDGLFRAAGIAAMEGKSPDPTISEYIWSQQLAHTTRINFLVLPVLQVAENRDHWETTYSTWHLCAFALSKYLSEKGIPLATSSLNPWAGLPTTERERSESRRLLSLSYEFNGKPHPARDHMFRIGMALLNSPSVGPVWDSGIPEDRATGYARVIPMQEPDALALLALGEQSIQDKLKPAYNDLAEIEFGLDALRDACPRHGTDVTAALRWCWMAVWATNERVLTSALFNTDYAVDIWKAIPSQLITPDLLKMLVEADAPLDMVGNDFWRGVQRLLESDPGTSIPDQYWPPAPDAVLRAGLIARLRGSGGEKLFEVVANRMPSLLVEYADTIARDPESIDLINGGRLRWLTQYFPREKASELLKAMKTWLGRPEYVGALDYVGGWLLWIAESRGPGWRDAFDLLQDHETSQGGLGI